MPSSSDLSPSDRDLLVRTVIGEAAGEPAEGQQAVASVVLNRLRSGQYGGSMRDVLLAPHQFEPWQTSAAKLLKVRQDSPEYAAAGQAVDAALGGADPTGGAVNFLNPDLVRARGDAIPSWASGSGQRIGQHIFYGGGDMAKTAQSSGAPSDDDFLKAWGVSGNVGATSAANGATPSDDDFLKQWGVGTKAAPATATTAAPAPSGPSSSTAPDADKQRALSIGEGFVEGLPIVGAPMVAGIHKLAAGVGSILDDRRYSDELADVEARSAAARAANPILSKGAEVVGGAAGLLPAMAAAPAAFGLGGGALPIRMGVSAATGAGIGAADAATRGNDVARGAELGGILGGVAPAAGEAIGAVANKVLGGSVTPSGAASRAIAEGIESSGRTPVDFAAEFAANPRLRPMDVDTNLLLQGQGIAAQPGEGRAILADAAAQRSTSAPTEVRAALDKVFGPVPDVNAYLENLKATTRANANTAFRGALDNAKPVDVSGVIQAIDSKVSPGVNQIVTPGSTLPRGPVEDELLRVRAALTNGNETLTDANRLHALQQRLRVTADELGKSSSGQERLAGSALRDVRGKINDAIDQATGGKFKAAQAQYADDMAIQEAFNKGTTVFRNRAGEAGFEDRPEYWRAWMKSATPQETAALKQGVRVAADQAIGSVRNAVSKGAAIVEPELNQAKLAAILGKSKAGQLTKALGDEMRMARTDAKMLEGSQTEMRRQAAERVKVNTNALPLRDANTTLTGLAVRGVEKAFGGMRGSFGATRNRVLAEALSEPGGATAGAMLRRGNAASARGRAAGDAATAATNLLLREEALRRNRLLPAQ